jgi:hypothetical protein
MILRMWYSLSMNKAKSPHFAECMDPSKSVSLKSIFLGMGDGDNCASGNERIQPKCASFQLEDRCYTCPFGAPEKSKSRLGRVVARLTGTI